ncbi:MAG: FkbM family methyltransferase [Sulfitobacter sp.]
MTDNVSKTETIAMASTAQKKPTHVAECLGVKVPDSPMLNATRIERINAARYEGQEIAGALSVVRAGDKVLELGAGIGIVGAVVAKNAKPKQVVSFEANPNLIEHIRALYKLNRLSTKIEVRNQVLLSAPDAPETMAFHIRNSFLGSSLIDTDTRATTRVDVPTASYAQIHEEYAPDVLLMDIEGGELDFLRHASLEGVRAIVIEFHPGAYGREGMMECKSILERAGFTKVPEHSTRQVWTCTFDAATRPPVPNEGWSRQMTTLENAYVVPPIDQGFVQRAGILNADGSYHSGGALWRNGRSLTVKPPKPEGELNTRKGTWLWGGVSWMHFGHFLTESMARLWALEHLEQEIDGVLFIPKRSRNGGEIIPFQHDMIRAMGCEVPMVCVDAPEQVECLIVPGQGFGLGAMITGTQEFRGAVAKRFGQQIKADGPEKLYISRGKLPAGRGTLIGETELETHLAEAGYTIYHPEKHDVNHQIATYKAARKVIAAEGSALHMLAMVTDAKTDVAIVVRRPSGATRNLELHLEAFSGKAPCTITELTRSWKPLGPAKPRNWMGELDMQALQNALKSNGFISASSESWAALDPAVVQERLGDRFEEVA